MNLWNFAWICLFSSYLLSLYLCLFLECKNYGLCYVHKFDFEVNFKGIFNGGLYKGAFEVLIYLIEGEESNIELGFYIIILYNYYYI